jgi:hypothetical protein
MLGRQSNGGGMAKLVSELVAALRDKPSRFAYVVVALVLSVVAFTLADVLPAPYDFRH